MVHALMLAVGALLLSGCVSGQKVPQLGAEYRQAHVRQEAMARAVARPMADAAARDLPGMSRPRAPYLSGARVNYVTDAVPVSVQLPIPITTGELMTLWGKAIGYTPMYASSFVQDRIVGGFGDQRISEQDLMSWVSALAGIRVQVIPESRLLFVTEAP